jgi:hypothetical protein
MTPAQIKAKELVEKFWITPHSYQIAKRLAYMCVDEILDISKTYAGKDYEFYKQVKEEIQKL